MDIFYIYCILLFVSLGGDANSVIFLTDSERYEQLNLTGIFFIFHFSVFFFAFVSAVFECLVDWKFVSVQRQCCSRYLTVLCTVC